MRILRERETEAKLLASRSPASLPAPLPEGAKSKNEARAPVANPGKKRSRHEDLGHD